MYGEGRLPPVDHGPALQSDEGRQPPLSAPDKKAELFRKCQDPAVLAAQNAQCDSEDATDQQTYDGLRNQFDSLNQATFQHNIAVTGYEQQLQSYQNAL